LIGELPPGWYLVQLFGWASGKPTVQRLVPIEKMFGWLFYPDPDAMTFTSKRHIKPNKQPCATASEVIFRNFAPRSSEKNLRGRR
jgi:hypothetical protein